MPWVYFLNTIIQWRRRSNWRASEVYAIHQIHSCVASNNQRDKLIFVKASIGNTFPDEGIKFSALSANYIHPQKHAFLITGIFFFSRVECSPYLGCRKNEGTSVSRLVKANDIHESQAVLEAQLALLIHKKAVKILSMCGPCTIVIKMMEKE